MGPLLFSPHAVLGTAGAHYLIHADTFGEHCATAGDDQTPGNI